ncbi:hypothetical protein EDD16DRAFT_1568368 [Pisolithus croceorrhizus]|nr:hypothetical protein EDD16DRAFT_1568368 [Pisolithus croceorrhizus]KAI6134564.1 hypothetical protein EV401DRAFT_1906651 [Pisolithus croceorrhizus]
MGMFAGMMTTVFSCCILLFNEMPVNSHQGFSVPLYALIWTGFANAHRFTLKAARFTITSSLEGNYCTRCSSTLSWWSVLMLYSKPSMV